VNVYDAAGNISSPTPRITHSVSLSRSAGGMLSSPDGKLVVSYSSRSGMSEGRLILVVQEPLPEAAGGLLERTLSTAYELPGYAYELAANLPRPLPVNVSVEMGRETGVNYAFYAVEDEGMVRLETITDGEGQFEAEVSTGTRVVFAFSDIPAAQTLPSYYTLDLYPNPFNAALQVNFRLPMSDRGSIRVYNILGQEVYHTSPGVFHGGVTSFKWEAIDQKGKILPSGIYFIQLKTELGHVNTQKVTLLK